mmetsp:Transcript_2047/g.4639  ORF Transcript_2047/g.4639 Transcript_2047/m.4639 type:complete len:818 (+) Transcript_2047:146-2599(+)
MSTAGGSRFQGGPSCEIFSAQGTDPLRKQGVGVSGRVRREFDKDIKSYALVCDGGPTCKVEFPGKTATRKSLGLTQRFLAMQIALPASADPFGIELTITDSQRTRRRLVISSAFRNITAHPLHVQLPLGAVYDAQFGESEDLRDDTVVPRGSWLTLCMDMQEIVSSNFPSINFRALEQIVLHGTCRARRLFTLKDQPPGMHGIESGTRILAPIPRQLQFPSTIVVNPPTVFFTMTAVYAWESVHGVEHHSPRSEMSQTRTQAKKLLRSRPSPAGPPASARSNSTLGTRMSTESPRTRRLLETRRGNNQRGSVPQTNTPLSSGTPKQASATPTSVRRLRGASTDEEDNASNFGRVEEDGPLSARRSGLHIGSLPAIARAKAAKEGKPSPRKLSLKLPIREERPSSGQPSSRSMHSQKSSAGLRSSNQENEPISARASMSSSRSTLRQKKKCDQVQCEAEHVYEEYVANSPLSPVGKEFQSQHPGESHKNHPTTSSGYVDIHDNHDTQSENEGEGREEEEEESTFLHNQRHLYERLPAANQQDDNYSELSDDDSNVNVNDDDGIYAENDGEQQIASNTSFERSEVYNEDLNLTQDEDELDHDVREGHEALADREGDVLDEDDEISLGEPAEADFELDGGDLAELSGTLDSPIKSDLRVKLAREREELAKMEARLDEEEEAVLSSHRSSASRATPTSTSKSSSKVKSDTNAQNPIDELSAQFLKSTISGALKQLSSTAEVKNQDGDHLATPIRGDDDVEEESKEPVIKKKSSSRSASSKASEANEGCENGDEAGGELDLVFDPILECYFCPKTNKYYKMK